MSDRYLGKFRNGTNRLRNYDYSNSGVYFVTVNVRGKAPVFGSILDGQMRLSELGQVVLKELVNSVEIRKSMNLEIPEFVIMPDHIHALISINPNEHKQHFKSNEFGVQSQNIGSVIRGFKAAVTTYARKNNILFDWQPRYYDRIIRNEPEFERTRIYIRDNVKNWKAINLP